MKRNQSDYATRDPEKRRLRIYATDPMSGRRAPYRITIEISQRDRPRDRSTRPTCRGLRLRCLERALLRERQPQRAAATHGGWPSAERVGPAIPPADGLRGRHEGDRQRDPGAWPQHVPVAQRASAPSFPHAFYGRNAFFDRSLTPFSSATSKPTEIPPARTYPARPSSPACRTTSSPTR